MSKRIFIHVSVYVLITLREFFEINHGLNKFGDIIHKYTINKASDIESYGKISLELKTLKNKSINPHHNNITFEESVDIIFTEEIHENQINNL